MPRASFAIRRAWETHLDADTRAYTPFSINTETNQLPRRTRTYLFPLLFDITGAAVKLKSDGDLTEEQADQVGPAIESHARALASTPELHRRLQALYRRFREAGGPRFLDDDPGGQLLAMAFEIAAQRRTHDDEAILEFLRVRSLHKARAAKGALESTAKKNQKALRTRIQIGWAGEPAVNLPATRSAAVDDLLAELAGALGEADHEPILTDPGRAAALWSELVRDPGLDRHLSGHAMALTASLVAPVPELLDGDADSPLDRSIFRRLTRVSQGNSNDPRMRVHADALVALERAIDASPLSFGLSAPASRATLLLAQVVAGRMSIPGDALAPVWAEHTRVRWITNHQDTVAFARAFATANDPADEVVRRAWNRVFRAEVNDEPVSSVREAWEHIHGAVTSVRKNLIGEVGEIRHPRTAGSGRTGVRTQLPDTGVSTIGVSRMQTLVDAIIAARFGDDTPGYRAYRAGLERWRSADPAGADFDLAYDEWEACIDAAVASGRFDIEQLPVFSAVLLHLKRGLTDD